MDKDTPPSHTHVLFICLTHLWENIVYCLACLVIPHIITYDHGCDCLQHLIYDGDLVFNLYDHTESSILKRYQCQSSNHVNSQSIVIKVLNAYHCDSSRQIAFSRSNIGHSTCNVNNKNPQHTFQQDNHQVWNHIDPEMPPPPLWTSLALRDHVATHPTFGSFLPEVQMPPFYSRPFPIENGLHFLYDNHFNGHLIPKQKTSINPSSSLSQNDLCDNHNFCLLCVEAIDCRPFVNSMSTEAQLINQVMIRLRNNLDIEPARDYNYNDSHYGVVRRHDSLDNQEEEDGPRGNNDDPQDVSPLSAVYFSGFDREMTHNNAVTNSNSFEDIDGQCDETGGLLCKDCIDEEFMDTSQQPHTAPYTEHDAECSSRSPQSQRPDNPVARVLERGGSEHMVPIITDGNGNPMNQ